MTRNQLLEEFARLPLHEQAAVLTDAMHILARGLELPPREESSPGEKLPLAEAAKLLLPDYREDKTLTEFTALDADDFHA